MMKRLIINGFIALIIALLYYKLVIQDKYSPHIPYKIVDDEQFDIIIVGGGTSGIVLANRLSDPQYNLSVLVLEAGGSDESLLTTIPALLFLAYYSPKLSWLYKSEKIENLNDQHFVLPSGKCLGGSSSVNAMMWTRGTKDDYDKWSSDQYGCKNWDYNSVLEYFKKSESVVQHSSLNTHNERGQSGKMNIHEPGENLFRVSRDIITSTNRAMNASNVPFDYNTSQFVHGVTPIQHNILNGKRHAVTQAYLTPDVLKRQNLHIVTNALVTRLLMNKRTVVGVEYQLLNKKKMKAFAKREVILSAGAIKSPHLLMVSGIGDEQELRKHDIPVVHHLPAVGKNLMDHMGPNISYSINYPTLLKSLTLSDVWEYMIHGTGKLSGGLAHVIGYLNTKYAESQVQDGVIRPDIQVFFINAVFTLNYKKMLAYPNAYGAKILLVHPRSRGSIQLKSSDPTVDPAIHLNYFSDYNATAGETIRDSLDMKRLVESIRLMRKIANTPPLADHNATEISPHEDNRPIGDSDDDLIQFIKDSVESIYHFTGTCAMGDVSRDTTVVNHEDLRVKGIKGLRVIDGSVIPEIVGCNTHASVVMVAEKGADLVLKDY